MRYVFSTKHTSVYRFPTHVNELVYDRSEATVTEVFIVVLEPGEAPPLHKHPDTEQVFYLLEGEAELRIGPEATDHFLEEPRGRVPMSWSALLDPLNAAAALVDTTGLFTGFVDAPEVVRTRPLNDGSIGRSTRWEVEDATCKAAICVSRVGRLS